MGIGDRYVVILLIGFQTPRLVVEHISEDGAWGRRVLSNRKLQVLPGARALAEDQGGSAHIKPLGGIKAVRSVAALKG